MSMKAVSMHNLAIVYNGGNAYRINFMFVGKSDALNLIKNAVIIDKKENTITDFVRRDCFLCVFDVFLST